MLIHKKKLNRQEWLSWLNACESATFYHTPYWYEIWQEERNYDPGATLFTVKNQEVFFAAATSRKLKGILKVLLSSPAGTYGGFLCRKVIKGDIFRQLLNELPPAARILLYSSPLQKFGAEIYTKTTEFSQLIELNIPFEEIFKKWSKGHSAAAKKGLREGVTVRRATDQHDWEHYYTIYAENHKQREDSATSFYPKSLFEKISTLPDEHCRLWLAEYQGKVISGSLIFYFNQHVSYWHGAGMREFLSLKGGHVLQYHIIKDAWERGFKWYDFNPSGGHENVVHFKNGFGGEIFSFFVIQKDSILIKGISFLQKNAAGLFKFFKRRQSQ